MVGGGEDSLPLPQLPVLAYRQPPAATEEDDALRTAEFHLGA